MEVEVIHGRYPPTLKPGVLYIWFRADDTVWLSRDGLWVAWKKGRSIGECLKEST